MENTEVNIQGSINCLEVNEKVYLPRAVCKPSVVRATATRVSLDTGKKFNVAAVEDEHNIIVTRIS